MEAFESFIKKGLLYFFCLLNTLDMAQTISFLRVRMESNPYAVNYPYIWFPLKILLAFGLPIGLYQLDIYLDEKGEEGFFNFLRSLVAFTYLTVLVADIFFLYVVLRNISILGGLV
jgi:hypothetical protein